MRPTELILLSTPDSHDATAAGTISLVSHGKNIRRSATARRLHDNEPWRSLFHDKKGRQTAFVNGEEQFDDLPEHGHTEYGEKCKCTKPPKAKEEALSHSAQKAVDKAQKLRDRAQAAEESRVTKKMRRIEKAFRMFEDDYKTTREAFDERYANFEEKQKNWADVWEGMKNSYHELCHAVQEKY